MMILRFVKRSGLRFTICKVGHFSIDFYKQ